MIDLDKMSDVLQGAKEALEQAQKCVTTSDDARLREQAAYERVIQCHAQHAAAMEAIARAAIADYQKLWDTVYNKTKEEVKENTEPELFTRERIIWLLGRK